MAGMPTEKPSTNNSTICLPIEQAEYETAVTDAAEFRRWLEQSFRDTPELFPVAFGKGFSLKDSRMSKKLGVTIRRVLLRDGTAWSIRPSFVMPGMVALTEDVQNGLFLRRFAVPFWALAQVFGRDHSFWHRTQNSLGRGSLAGTTVRHGEIPDDLSADEHHQTLQGEKVYIATTVGSNCFLGAELSPSAGADDLTAAYGVFQQEALNIDPDYHPETVNTDGWGPTHTAWKALFRGVTILVCFLHAWLKIRNRCKKHESFQDVSDQVWDAYRAKTKRNFSQRLRRLKSWAMENLTGWIRETTLDLCRKRDQWSVAYDHPNGRRTSNMLDRLMRSMNRYYDSTQHLHGKGLTSHLTTRSQALLWNFSPWHPSETRRHDGWQSPAENLNRHRYHDEWLQNLLISASCGGYRR